MAMAEEDDNIFDVLAQLHQDEEAGLPDGMEEAQLIPKVSRIQRNITQTLLEAAASWEPSVWFDYVEKALKHLSVCDVLVHGSSCAEPCCVLRQHQQEFKAEERPMVVQAVHQAIAKAVDQAADGLEVAMTEWHQVLNCLEAVLQSYETTQSRQNVVNSNTLASLRADDPGVLMDQKCFETGFPADINLMRMNGPTCKRGCQAARELLEAGASGVTVESDNGCLKFWHRCGLALSELKPHLADLSPKKSVTIVCPGTIYVDCDLDLPGTSFAVQAGHVEILGCRTLSLKGSTAAEPEGKPSRAKHAIEKGENKMDGDPGIGGKDGEAGGSGGHFYCHARVSAKDGARWTVRCQGATGGKGQDGGDGGDGRAATKGKDASLPKMTKRAYAILCRGEQANPGGNAGAQGPGGQGGDGGYHGEQDVKDFWASSCAIFVESPAGRAEDGPPGIPGKCGKVGPGAAHGVNKGAIKRVNASANIMEGAGLRIQKKEGAAWAEDYMREFKIEWVFNWAKVWMPFCLGLLGVWLAYEEKDDCDESFTFAKGVPTTSLKGRAPAARDVQSKHHQHAVHAAGIPKQQLRNQLVAEVQQRLSAETWPSNQLVASAQDLSSAYGCQIDVPVDMAQGSRAQALKQAVNMCAEQIQQRHNEQVQSSMVQQQACVLADVRNDCQDTSLGEAAPVPTARPMQVAWSGEWPKRCGDFGSPVWELLTTTSSRPAVQEAIHDFELAPSMSNLLQVANTLEEDEEVPEVLENLQKAAAAGLFQASDAQKLLQSSVKAIRDEAAEVAFGFRAEREQEMMLCLLSLDSALKADLCEMQVEILQQKALDARRNRNMWIGAGELDFFLLQNLMTFDKEKAFTDMQEAGNLLLRLMPVVPQESLGCWHENYRLFMRSLGCFESKAVVTCAKQLLSTTQPDETLCLVLIDWICGILLQRAMQIARHQPLRSASLEIITEKPQVLGPVARCLQLLVSCEQGVNIAQTWQEQEEVAAVDDEDVRRIHKEIALASQEMCGRQAEDCNAILRQRHQKALEYLLKVAHNDQVFCEVASWYASALLKLRMAVAHQWQHWGLAACNLKLKDSLEEELRSATGKLVHARYGVPASSWRISVPGNLCAVEIRTASGSRACKLEGTTFNLPVSESASEVRFCLDEECQVVDCKLEAKCKEWIEVWQGSVLCTAKWSAWIPCPSWKPPQFRYFKLDGGDADSVAVLEGRTCQGPMKALAVCDRLAESAWFKFKVKDEPKVFDFQKPCQVTALRVQSSSRGVKLPSVIQASQDREHWWTLEVDPLEDGWQALCLNGLRLDPAAAVEEAAQELRQAEEQCEAASYALLKDFSTKAQDSVDKAVAMLDGTQPWYRMLEALATAQLHQLENLPKVSKFLEANQMYRWNPAVTLATKKKNKKKKFGMAAYNASNRKALDSLLSGGTDDDMVHLFRAHLQVAERCVERADVENWIHNHAKAELSEVQAETARALCAKDHVDGVIKDVILEKWQETLAQNHNLDGLRFPWFLFQEASAVSLAQAPSTPDFCSLVLQKFLEEEELQKLLPRVLLNALENIGKKDSVAAARFCLAIHQSLMSAQESGRSLFSYVVVETTSSEGQDEVTEVQFEIGGETIPLTKGNDNWSFCGPRAFCVSFCEPQELTAVHLVAKEPANTRVSKAKVARILGSEDGRTWVELAREGCCDEWLAVRPEEGEATLRFPDFQTWELSVWDLELGGGPALLQTALAGGKEALKPLVKLLESCSSPARAAAAIASQPWNWSAWMHALSLLEIEQITMGLSEEERKSLYFALRAHPPAVAIELFLGYQREVQALGDGKGACPLRVWVHLTDVLQRLHSSEVIVDTFREERCRNWPGTLQALLLEERLQRYADAHPQVETDQDLQIVTIFSRILQSTYGGLGVVKCLDLMEQKSDAREPMKADSQFLALIWKWRMDVDQVFARLQHVDRACWRESLAAMREEGERTAEQLAQLMEIAATCDAEKTTVRDALKLVQDSRRVLINSKPVEELQEKDIQDWMRTARDSGKAWLMEHRPEVMALLCRASTLASNWQPYDSQKLPLAMLMQGHRVALQCLTGEGKQLLLALFSAYRALLFKDGYLIVLTSDADLASREPEELKNFYEMVGLRVGHNVSEEVQVRKQTYQDVDVVYAHQSLLLTDYLLTEFFHQEVLPDAEHTWKDTCILDEADKLCADDAGNTLYLAQDIAGLEHAEGILVNAFAAGQCVSNEESLREVETELKKCLEDGSIACPNSIKDFAKRRMPRWLQSVLVARQMQEGTNFILRCPKGDESSGPQPISMDLPSGKEQWTVRLSDGLQQFLSLQYDCYVDAESLRSVFVSPVTFFKKVQEFFGVTGTLGGDHDRDFLRGLFDVGLFDVPPRLPKRVEELDPVVAVSTCQWLDEVSAAAMASLQRGQASLVVCQTAREAESVYEACKKSSTGTVHLCAEEAHKQVTQLSPGDILVATNNCARGVNIKVDSQKSGGAWSCAARPSQQKVASRRRGSAARRRRAGRSRCVNIEVDSPTIGTDLQGTLNVICAYWPGVREQSQIFGRTCRNGAHGSVQLVLLVPEAAKEARHLQPFLVLQLLMQGRLEQTADELWHLESVSLAQVECSASLFDKFQAAMQEMWDKLQLKDRDDIVWKCVSNVLCADFAFWLDRKDQDLEKISSSNRKAAEKKLKDDLDKEVLATWTGSPDVLVQRSYAESVKLAAAYLKQGKEKAGNARLLLEAAIKMEDGSGFSYAAHYFMGAALLMLDNSKTSWPEARKHFDEAHMQFLKRQAEHVALAQVQSTVNGCAGRPCNGRYLQQTGEKAQLVALHVHSTGTVCGADVGPDLFLTDVGIEDGQLWRSKQLYNALREQNAIIEDKVRIPAGKEVELNWLHPNYADKVREAIKHKQKKGGRLTLEDCYAFAGSSSKVWKYLLDHAYLGEEKSSGFVVVEALDPEQQNGLTVVDGGLMVDWDSSKAKELQELLRKKDADELEQTKSAKCLDSFLSLLTDPMQKVWKDTMKASQTNADQSGRTAALMAVRGALQENLNKDAKPLPDTALFKNDLLTECASFASATAEAVAQIWIGILVCEAPVVLLRSLPDPGRMLHVRLHEDGVLLPPRINPSADLHRAVERVKGGKNGIRQAVDWIGEAFVGKGQKDPVEQIVDRMEDAKGLFDTAEDSSTIKVSLHHIMEEMSQVPQDARMLEAAGLSDFLKFEENKSWWSWGAFWVAMIGLAQVVVGAILICCGCPQIGMFLLAEGVGDMVYAVQTGLTGSFSWRAYAMHKVVSLAISFATCGIGKLFKLGKEVAKGVTKKGVTKLVGKMVAEGAFFAAAEVGIDKLLEEARKFAIVRFADTLSEKMQEMLAPLKQVLCQVILHFGNTAAQRITSIGEAALHSYAFQIAGQTAMWVENVGSQLASKAQSSSKASKYFKVVNAFLTTASILTRLGALIKVLWTFVSTVKSELEKLVEGKDEKESTEEAEEQTSALQDTLGKLVVDKASSEVISGFAGPAVKFVFRKATQHATKRLCEKVKKIQGKLQAQSKELLPPPAVLEESAVKPKGEKKKAKKVSKLMQPAMEQPSPDKKKEPKKKPLSKEQEGEKSRKNQIEAKVENVREKVSELNFATTCKNLLPWRKREKTIQLELSSSPLEAPREIKDGKSCIIKLVPRTNAEGTVVKHGRAICKEPLLGENKKKLDNGVCRAHESNTKAMVALHAISPEAAQKCARVEAHAAGAPSLDYSKKLAREQLYTQHFDSLVDKLSENNAYLKKERDGTAKLKTKLEAKASKGKLTPLECKQLSSCKTELLKVDARIKKFDNLQLKVCEMHAEISDRGHAKLNYQKVGSVIMDKFSSQHAEPNKKHNVPPKGFLDICGQVQEMAQNHLKQQLSKKDPQLANYTVRGHFEVPNVGRHAVTFFILTHQDKGKPPGPPFQTVHFSDSNTGDAIARSKNWSSLKKLSQSLLDHYSNNKKCTGPIKFYSWATEKFEHARMRKEFGQNTGSRSSNSLANSAASLKLPHDMSRELNLMTRLNAFPKLHHRAGR